ncbi:helix-turn-helix domain-containing protein [Streptomyces sp. NPDC058371]|uniref:helix-turn-helix domain-containing protein n=1 Tax=Streptomyces sp. NPDC058371 TaxID=3346463 RepID=UPI0036672D20
MSTTQRKQQFGAYLGRLRRDARLSQRQLADRLCAASGVATLTRNEVSRWERGVRVPDAWLPALAAVLGARPETLEAAAAYARGEAEWRLPGAFATLAELLPPGDPLERLTGAQGRRIGPDAVAALAGRVHGLRLADDVLAGGDLIVPAFRELASAVRLHRESAYTEPTGRALLVQIGELAQISGWIASDAGQHAQAEQAYRLGISAARQAGDGALVANLAGSLAYQLSNTERELDGLDMARAAVAEAGPEAPAQTRALFFDRVAWAHAQAGQPQPAMRALGQAHEALTEDGGPEAPAWAYWVSREELEVMDARVFTELRRPLRAVPLLRSVLARYDATHARELALYLSWLAVAYADANEPEEAAATALRMFDLSADMASERTTERGRVVLRRLAAFDDVPEVRAVLAEHPG